MSVLSVAARAAVGFRAAVGLALVVSVSGCGALSEVSFGRGAEVIDTPVMRWDHHPEGGDWTAMAFAALDTHASVLPMLVPEDIEAWCPAYPEAPLENRQAFWTGLMSALARHESTWNPEAVGGGGRWFGLVQISPATARHYGCQATSGQALLDGSANISCAMRIWASTVPRDGVVAQSRGGVAADWGPFVQAPKREEMRQWISEQPYCAG
ncbi:transglycosylase SLT domain-containing protein [Rhodobacteraceae bacterium N5(2021)]|uniref:Transglycosylase SLT domain-containing protein n=1 Tax=Gymnodinialimonas phycosphaerae TaxID=2841589 RepID=A0A975TVQ4_9RHOB|nr:transglycosylase SLT domain-containing protein [Gymnodinialimonas phycosphaerae]MBY4891670.1 transglycosylase SLT domain-containing protein [Gymnodinialimonas phycosphaerae]